MSQFSHALESLEPRQFLSVSTNTATTSTNDGLVPILVPATPQPTEGGVKLNEYSGQRFTAKLGEFHLKVSDLALNAVVNWGDGTKSNAKIEGSYATGEWYVEGT